MNREKCRLELAKMAAIAPHNVWGSIDRLAYAVDHAMKPHGYSSAMSVTNAIRHLRGEGINVDGLLAAMEEPDPESAKPAAVG
jgi:hypothetical protein